MITVRRAGMQDLPALVPLFDAYRVFYGQTSDPQAAEQFLRDLMTRQQSVIFLALSQEKAEGFTQLYPIFSSVRMKPSWLLNDLFVSHDARRKGIATLLLERAKKEARDSGAAWLLLSTGASNLAGQALYEGNGWQRTSDVYYEFMI